MDSLLGHRSRVHFKRNIDAGVKRGQGSKAKDVGPAVSLPIRFMVIARVKSLRRTLLEVAAWPPAQLRLRLLRILPPMLLGSRSRGLVLSALRAFKHYLRVKSRLLRKGRGVHGSCVLVSCAWRKLRGDEGGMRRKDEEGRQ